MGGSSSKYAATSYRRYQRVKGRQADIFSRAIAYKESHEWMLAERQTRLFQTPDYARLTQAQRFALSELWHAASGDLYRYRLEWRLGPASGPVRTAGEAWTPEMSELSGIPGALYGAHFWRGSDRTFAPYAPINPDRSGEPAGGPR